MIPAGPAARRPATGVEVAPVADWPHIEVRGREDHLAQPQRIADHQRQVGLAGFDLPCTSASTGSRQFHFLSARRGRRNRTDALAYVSATSPSALGRRTRSSRSGRATNLASGEPACRTASAREPAVSTRVPPARTHCSRASMRASCGEMSFQRPGAPAGGDQDHGLHRRIAFPAVATVPGHPGPRRRFAATSPCCPARPPPARKSRRRPKR